MQKENYKTLLIPIYDKKEYSQFFANECNNELASLCFSANLDVVNLDNLNDYTIKYINPKTYLPKGTIEKIKKEINQYKVDSIVISIEISPSQQKNLTSYFNKKIITKTELIYEIFLERANSSISKIQIELANLKYAKTRLAGSYKGMDRIRGGIGIKGAGETKLEVDKRNLNKRINKLRKKLKKYEKHYELILDNHKNLNTISLVGYTNAGKSSLLNKLTKANQESKNLLFSTVQVKSKKLFLDIDTSCIVTDTIGFIRDLPTNLVESFKTTLMEIKYSKLLLLVVDINSDFFNDHIDVVKQTLKDIGCENTNIVIVFNKIDIFEGNIDNLEKRYPGAFFISTKNGDGIEHLKKEISKFFKLYK